MKRITLLLHAMLIAIMILPSCSDEKDPIYELKTAPIMDSPAGYYVLNAESKEFIMETFTWSKGEYGFEAAPVYGVEACLSRDFDEDIVELTSSNDMFSNVTVARMNAVLQGWEVAPEVETDIFIRVKATMNGANTIFVYSDPVLITVVGFKDAAPVKPALYIVGSTMNPDAEWANDASKIGTGLIPIFTDNNSSKDFTYTYTGFFRKGEFKLVVTPGDWGNQYGMSGGVFVAKTPDLEPGNIVVAADGYYKMTLNIDEMTFSMEAFDASATPEYTKIGLIGGFNDWGGDHELAGFTHDSKIYGGEVTFEADSEIKFRANGGWDINWGSNTFTYGVGVNNGSNIPAEAGSYYVQLNTITGHYLFIKK
ncbi:MAG: SusE domain-containing protein [Bacteroidales bacterium]